MAKKRAKKASTKRGAKKAAAKSKGTTAKQAALCQLCGIAFSHFSALRVRKTTASW